MSRKPIIRGLATLLLFSGLVVLPATTHAAPRAGAESGWDLFTWVRTAWTAIWDRGEAGQGMDPG